MARRFLDAGRRLSYDDGIRGSPIRTSDLLAPGDGRRRVILAFLLSLAVRAFVALPVVIAGTPPKFDERSYFRRAEAFVTILKDVARFRSPDKDARDAFYEDGTRPPFQSVTLSLAVFLFGGSVAAARFLMVLLSSLTTALVLLVTERLAGPKAGLAAAGSHIVHPSFVAFSHYLWAETTFILLLFLSVLLALRVMEAAEPRRKAWLSVLLGVVLGCLAMTRSAALLPVALLPAWVLATGKPGRARFVATGLVLAFSFLAVLPWEATLFRREHRIVPLANVNYRNLYLGNNPWMDGAEDDSDDWIPVRVRKDLSDAARERSVHIETAARDLALRHIAAHPGASLAHAVRGGLFLWTFDFYPLRHVVNAAYSPMPSGIVFPLILVLATAALGLYLLVLKGLLVRTPRMRGKVLLLALVAGGAAPYALTLGNSRYNLPQIALLIPVAGFGLSCLKERTRAFLPLAVLLAGASLALFVRSYPDYIYHRLRPSSAYSGAIGPLDRVSGKTSLYGDVFLLEDPEAERAMPVMVTIVDGAESGFSFDRSEPQTRTGVTLSPAKKRAPFIIYGHRLRGPLKIRISSPERGGEVDLVPVDRAFWDRSREIGLGSLRLRWRGGR